MRIAIDAGHGTNTPGKRTPPFPYDVTNGNITVKKGEQYKEHYANVGVCVALQKELKRCGFEVVKTGWDNADASNDADTPLSTRQDYIADKDCDYSISIHYNAHGDGNTFTSANGTEIFIHTTQINQSDKLAKLVLDNLIAVTGQVNRGVKKYSYAMCKCNELDVKGAILVELAFMTNLKETTEYMTNEEYWSDCAEAIAKGLCQHVGIKYIPNDYTPSKSITKKSPKDDILWLQSKLNYGMPNKWPLKLDGVYGNNTRIAVLILWEIIKWNKDGTADGWKAGQSTIKYLK